MNGQNLFLIKKKYKFMKKIYFNFKDFEYTFYN